MSSKCALHGSAEQKSTHAMCAHTFQSSLFQTSHPDMQLAGASLLPRSLLWAVYSGRGRDDDLKPARFAGSQRSVGAPFHCLGDARAMEITPRATVHIHCFPQIGGGGGVCVQNLKVVRTPPPPPPSSPNRSPPLPHTKRPTKKKNTLLSGVAPPTNNKVTNHSTRKLKSRTM